MAAIIALDKRGKKQRGHDLLCRARVCCTENSSPQLHLSQHDATVGYRATFALRVDDQRVDVALGNLGMVADHDGKP